MESDIQFITLYKELVIINQLVNQNKENLNSLENLFQISYQFSSRLSEYVGDETYKAKYITSSWYAHLVRCILQTRGISKPRFNLKVIRVIFMFTEDISVWMNKNIFLCKQEKVMRNDFILRVICIQLEQIELAVVSSCLSFFTFSKYLANLNAVLHCWAMKKKLSSEFNSAVCNYFNEPG